VSGSHVLPHPYDITLFGHDVFVTDRTKLALLATEKFGGSDMEALTAKLPSPPNGVTAYHSLRQPQGTLHSVVNAC